MGEGQLVAEVVYHLRVESELDPAPPDKKLLASPEVTYALFSKRNVTLTLIRFFKKLLN